MRSGDSSCSLAALTDTGGKSETVIGGTGEMNARSQFGELVTPIGNPGEVAWSVLRKSVGPSGDPRRDRGGIKPHCGAEVIGKGSDEFVISEVERVGVSEFPGRDAQNCNIGIVEMRPLG